MRAKDTVYKGPNNTLISAQYKAVSFFLKKKLTDKQMCFTLRFAQFLNSSFSLPVIPHRSSITKYGHCLSDSYGCSYSQGALEQNSEHIYIQSNHNSIEKRKFIIVTYLFVAAK